MKTLRQICIDNIIEKLGWLKSYIELNNSLNFNDINIVSEDFFCFLMNSIYDYKLVNLNNEKLNFPGIDLGDTSQRISVQVTSDRTRKKVEKTIETFIKNDYIQKFDRLIFLILGQKSNFTKPFNAGKLSFDSKKDVIDIEHLLLDINKLDDSKIQEINIYINNNLIISTSQSANVKEDLILSQYKIVYALCLTKLKSIGIDDKTSRSIIANGLMENPYPSLQNINYLVGGFGTGKSHSLYIYYLYLYKCLQEGTSSIVPIFIDAKTLLQFNNLESWINEHHILPNNYTFILDGLDEIEYTKIELLMHELEFFNNLYTNFNAIIGSREMSILAGKEILPIKQLSLPDINNLYCQINHLDSYNVEYHIKDTNREQMLKMLSKPFFAIIYSLYMSNTNYYLKNEMDLTSLFVEKSISPYIQKNHEIYDIFDQLAVLSIDRNLGYIHKSEISENINFHKLLSSGFLITDGKDNYSFSLPIVTQWLGAHAIRKNVIKMDDILKDKSKVIKWRYSLSILFSQMTYEESEEYFKQIVLTMPSVASIIIRDGINFESAINLPSSDICGKRLYDCMNTWLSGLSGIDFDLKSDGIHTNTLACSVYKNRITYSWANCFLEKEVIRADFERPDQYFHSICSRSIPAQATWPWIVTFEHLSKILENYVKDKHWILIGTSLEKEFIWKNALELLHKGSLFCAPIPLTEFDIYRKNLDKGIIYSNKLNLSLFFELMNSYIDEGHTELLPPYIVGDSDYSSGWIWGNYSKERMLERITDTYTKSICEYKKIVEICFCPFKEYMSTYLILPCTLNGILEYDVDSNTFSSGPSMTWFLSPLPPNLQSFCQIKYSDRDDIWTNSSSIFDELKKKTSQLRPENDHYINYTIHSGKCFDSSATPTTDIIYSWLKDDLKKIGWIK